MAEIHIFSCGIGDDLSAEKRKIIDKADLVAGSKALLDRCVIVEEKRRYLTAHAVTEIAELTEEISLGKSAVVLGSGDALFHGIGATVKNATEHTDISLYFYPAPSAFQHLCHKVQIPWHELKTFSVHHGNHIPLREILTTKLAVVYGGAKYNAAQIARELCRCFPAAEERGAIIADRLGYSDEHVHQGTLGGLSLEPVSATSMILLLEPDNPSQVPLTMQGTPNCTFQHEAGLITAEEVRAVALAKLRLPHEGVLWDLGAGSGSVGIEAAGIYPTIKVHAVEKNASRTVMIKENCRHFGLHNVTVHANDVLSAIESLPNPDRVFIGGGGTDITTIAEKVYSRLPVGGIMVITAVTIETVLAVQNWSKPFQREAITIDIAKEDQLGSSNYHLYRSSNRITIFTLKKI